METPQRQPSPGPSVTVKVGSRLAQQTQEDPSTPEQDSRQLDDVIGGKRRDQDEAWPRDILHFLEEHFTCAL